MKRSPFLMAALSLSVLIASAAEKNADQLIADALSAGPPSVTEHATVKDSEGKVLRQGTNDWTCYPGSSAAGPMCNRSQWDVLIQARKKHEPIDVKEFSVSYMLAGEGDALGVSNFDPYATQPDAHWVKEGPHLMILVPDPAQLEGLSTDPKDPVYVMWKGTPYAHIMVKIAPKK
jgi:hypothetical protein